MAVQSPGFVDQEAIMVELDMGLRNLHCGCLLHDVRVTPLLSFSVHLGSFRACCAVDAPAS
jgi:hypothetical protein